MNDTTLVAAEPLSPSETKWLRRLERVLKAMPERVMLVEAGDWLTLVDREAARDFELCDGGAGRPEVHLADVRHSGMKVMGVSA